MAIATSTALAIGGMAVSAAGAGMSFAQAAKQNRLMSEAETKAAEALAAGKKELEKNYYAGLAIQKEPYELQREAMMGAAAQAVEAGQESERGAAATAGRIYEAAQQGQGDIRATMGKELSDLEKLKAAEESRLSGEKSKISLEEAAGYNQAAADAQKAAAQATTGAIQGMQLMGQQALDMMPLYFKKKPTTPTTATNNFVMQNRQNADTAAQWTSQFLQGFNNPTKSTMLEKPFYQYPSGQVGGILNPNQPQYNAGTYNPFMIFQ